MSQRSGPLLSDGLTREEIAIIEESLQEKVGNTEGADDEALEENQ